MATTSLASDRSSGASSSVSSEACDEDPTPVPLVARERRPRPPLEPRRLRRRAGAAGSAESGWEESLETTIE
ncbi:MAG: hypothetical protein ACRDV9_04070, partial [Acidimicrobiia bacterium]